MAVDPARAKSLFLAASDIADPAERAAYLDRECGDDAELRARVEALLRATMTPPPPDDRRPTTVAAPGVSRRADRRLRRPGTSSAGAVIAGKYTLVEVIGEGGMGGGLAWPSRPSRSSGSSRSSSSRPGMDSKAVLARFEAERQALALMDHPNIAKVLDGGLHRTAGRSSSWNWSRACRSPSTATHRKLTPKERLELFVPVCQAIQHAHQKGIIHRDIKPTNVLVALYDDKPVVKVIDFGVAKATGGTLTEADDRHRVRRGGRHAAVHVPGAGRRSTTWTSTPARDVYALGVLLYELLTGSPPFAAEGTGEDAGCWKSCGWCAKRSRRGRAPSCRTADALPTLSANRGTEPKKLTGSAAERTGLDRDEGAGEGPHPAVRDGQRLRRATCCAT